LTATPTNVYFRTLLKWRRLLHRRALLCLQHQIGKSMSNTLKHRNKVLLSVTVGVARDPRCPTVSHASGVCSAIYRLSVQCSPNVVCQSSCHAFSSDRCTILNEHWNTVRVWATCEVSSLLCSTTFYYAIRTGEC